MIKFWLYLPPLWMHQLSLLVLKFRGLLFKPRVFKWKLLKWRRLEFQNPLGTAAGLDKSADSLRGWWTYGPGFLEIGTLTVKKQKQNPGPILKRDLKNQALWNYMGFPNPGCRYVLSKLQQIKFFHTPVFISIGKSRDTPLEKAFLDYQYLMEQLHPYASAFIINISSPNTRGLRNLFQSGLFEPFLNQITLFARSLKPAPPLLLKMSPDLPENQFLNIISASQNKVDGWVICNTTTQHNSLFPHQGGVSGRPLAQKSQHLLKKTVQLLGHKKQDKLIVSSGGCMTAQDVFERIQLGADLVQVYSALVFEGPSFFKKVHQAYFP